MKKLIKKETAPSWDEIKCDFLIGMMNSLDPVIQDHLKKCKKCNDDLTPKLIELYNVMIIENPKVVVKLNEIVRLIGTHMGLDPQLFETISIFCGLCKKTFSTIKEYDGHICK